MKHRAFWTALEYTCRLLGISTAAVLVGVGAETLQRGQFQSLAVYLLFSGAAVSICEVSFFVSLLLGMCISYQPGSLAHTFWKRTTQPASFQKFLGYVLLSVACFLHPVLVWHVTIPGEERAGAMYSMGGRGMGLHAWLVLPYFRLSKRKKSPVRREARGPLEQYVDPCATAATSTGCGDTEQTFTFPGGRREQRTSLLGQMKSILKGSEDKAGGWLADQEKLVRIIPSVSESPDDAESEAEETTSDTAPILGPTETPLLVTPLSATGQRSLRSQTFSSRSMDICSVLGSRYQQSLSIHPGPPPCCCVASPGPCSPASWI
ncbi:Transmembrane protein 72 [Chelonia mydas]|uniref:Transmembrane protein 72 n=1 Tax=Chelonia mydas TaxID=8469 RepID=M7AMV5_CHEMY|nr:Transmembrane protein 72 [Chelonia mydas]